MLGGEEFVSAVIAAELERERRRSPARARLGRRTKDLVKRLGPGDVAIIDHADLDRVSAEELAESGRARSRQRLALETGPLPEPGPARARARGRPPRRRARRGALRGALRRRAGPRASGAAIWRNGTLPRRGHGSRGSRPRGRARRAAEPVAHALEAFADNTLRHLRDEARLLSDGIEFPPLETRFRDRHALVVARGPGYKSRPADRAPVRPRVQAGARRRRRWRRRAARDRAPAARDRRRLRLGLRRGAPGGRGAARPRLRRTGRPGRRSASRRLGLAFHDRLRAGDQRGHRPPARARARRGA